MQQSSSYYKSLVRFFYANRDRLAKEHHGKFAVISDFEVKTTFDTMIEGVAYGVKHYGWENFIVQQCLTREELPPIDMKAYKVLTTEELQ